MKRKLIVLVAACFLGITTYGQDSTSTNTHKSHSRIHNKKKGYKKHHTAAINKTAPTNSSNSTGGLNGTMPGSNDPGKVTTNPKGKTGPKTHKS